jgi:hypothetical protein
MCWSRYFVCFRTIQQRQHKTTTILDGNRVEKQQQQQRRRRKSPECNRHAQRCTRSARLPMQSGRPYLISVRRPLDCRQRLVAVGQLLQLSQTIDTRGVGRRELKSAPDANTTTWSLLQCKVVVACMSRMQINGRDVQNHRPAGARAGCSAERDSAIDETTTDPGREGVAGQAGRQSRSPANATLKQSQPIGGRRRLWRWRWWCRRCIASISPSGGVASRPFRPFQSMSGVCARTAEEPICMLGLFVEKRRRRQKNANRNWRFLSRVCGCLCARLCSPASQLLLSFVLCSSSRRAHQHRQSIKSITKMTHLNDLVNRYYCPCRSCSATTFAGALKWAGPP